MAMFMLKLISIGLVWIAGCYVALVLRRTGNISFIYALALDLVLCIITAIIIQS